MRSLQLRVEELSRGLMADAAPHRERKAVLSSAPCDSDRARGNGMELCQERGRLGVSKRFFTGRWWAWNGLPRAVGTAPRATFQGAFGQRSQIVGVDFGWPVWSWGLDWIVLVGAFQLGMFCHSLVMILSR